MKSSMLFRISTLAATRPNATAAKPQRIESVMIHFKGFPFESLERRVDCWNYGPANQPACGVFPNPLAVERPNFHRHRTRHLLHDGPKRKGPRKGKEIGDSEGLARSRAGVMPSLWESGKQTKKSEGLATNYPGQENVGDPQRAGLS